MIELTSITREFPDVEFTFKHHENGIRLECRVKEEHILASRQVIIENHIRPEIAQSILIDTARECREQHRRAVKEQLLNRNR